MKKINIKTIYLVAVISIGLICLAIGSTYAMFTTSAEINNPITISSNLTSNDDTMETFEVEVSPSATVTKTINISSGTVSNVNYSVWYINDISNIDIGVSSTSYTTAGTISNANTTVTTKISIRNNSSTTKTVTLGVALSKNSIVLASNMSLVPQKTLSNPLATHITNLYNNSTKTNVTNNGIDYEYNTVNSLMYDNYGSIRYYGANPNNYVYFNCDDYSNQSASTCEIWRILGSFFTPSGGNQVRIIRNNVINNFKWDSLANEGGWPDAGLHHALNYDYINKNSGACSFASTQTCDFSSTGLKNDATRNAISDFEWLINPITTELISAYPNDIYENEINSGTTTWTGRVGIMYLSDYAYATDLSKCSNVIADYSNSSCSSNNWLKSSSDEWTISNYNNNYEQIYYIGTDGSINTDDFLIEHNFRPTLYLKSEQTFQGGTGTLADPYQLVIR